MPIDFLGFIVLDSTRTVIIKVLYTQNFIIEAKNNKKLLRELLKALGAFFGVYIHCKYSSIFAHISGK